MVELVRLEILRLVQTPNKRRVCSKTHKDNWDKPNPMAKLMNIDTNKAKPTGKQTGSDIDMATLKNVKRVPLMIQQLVLNLRIPNLRNLRVPNLQVPNLLLVNQLLVGERIGAFAQMRSFG